MSRSPETLVDPNRALSLALEETKRSYSVFVPFRKTRLTMRRAIPSLEEARVFAERVRKDRFHGPEDVFIIDDNSGERMSLSAVDPAPSPVLDAAPDGSDAPPNRASTGLRQAAPIAAARVQRDAARLEAKVDEAEEALRRALRRCDGLDISGEGEAAGVSWLSESHARWLKAARQTHDLIRIFRETLVKVVARPGGFPSGEPSP